MSSTCTSATAPTSPPRWPRWPQPPTHHQRRILALPATETAADYAHTHRYADTTTTAATGCEQPQSGRWSLPTGSLVIVDDADHLPADQLAWLTEQRRSHQHQTAAHHQPGARPHPRPHPHRRPRHPPALGPTPRRPRPRPARSTAMQHAATHLAATGDRHRPPHPSPSTAGPPRPAHRPLPHPHPRPQRRARPHLTRDRDHGLEL